MPLDVNSATHSSDPGLQAHAATVTTLLNTRCEKALRLAVTDSLTGLYTFGFMQEALLSQLQHAQQHNQPYSVIFADIDHFKRVNDRSGHAAGDAALRTVASALRDLVRQ